MIYSIRKRILFFVGVFVTGLVGILSSHIRTQFSKNDSLIVSTAHADVNSATCDLTRYTQAQCDNYYSCDGGCFPAGTPISTPSGNKEIQSLMIGDLVYGYDTETGNIVTAAITETMKHSWDEVHDRSPLLIIAHGKGVITLTANHWVYRHNGRRGEYANFDRAGMLEVGDVMTMEDGKEVAITKIDKGPEYDFVYNLGVENVHTYFADGVRVHNSGDGGCSGDGCGACGSK